MTIRLQLRLRYVSLYCWLIWLFSRTFKGPFICECGDIIDRHIVIKKHINARLARGDMLCAECLYYEIYDFGNDYEEPEDYIEEDNYYENWPYEEEIYQ